MQNIKNQELYKNFGLTFAVLKALYKIDDICLQEKTGFSAKDIHNIIEGKQEIKLSEFTTLLKAISVDPVNFFSIYNLLFSKYEKTL